MLRQLRNAAGMTLIEMLLAITISTVIGMGIMRIFQANSQLFSGEKKVSQTYSNARNVVGVLSRQLREMGYNPTEDTNEYFGLKDSTGSFTKSAITSINSIYFTSDYNEDGVLAKDATERFAWRLNGTDLQVASINSTTGDVLDWTTRYADVSKFDIIYTYADGTGNNDAAGNALTTSLPDDSTSNHRYKDVRMVTLVVNIRSSTKHDLTKQYLVEDDVDTSVLLRNNQPMQQDGSGRF